VTEAGFESNERRNEGQARYHAVQCDGDGCGLPAVARVDGHSFCLSHFIAYCYKKLESHKWATMGDTKSPTVQHENRFLRECARQAADLASSLRGFENIDRARLFDIFLWASEVISKRAELQGTENGEIPTAQVTGQGLFPRKEISLGRTRSQGH
jgi:hypothetical protein